MSNVAASCLGRHLVSLNRNPQSYVQLEHIHLEKSFHLLSSISMIPYTDSIFTSLHQRLIIYTHEKMSKGWTQTAEMYLGVEVGYLFEWRVCSHITCTHICERPTTPRAFDHAFEDVTSTRQESKSNTFSNTHFWLATRSGGSWIRKKWA